MRTTLTPLNPSAVALTALLHAANDLADTIEASPFAVLVGDDLAKFRAAQHEFDAAVGA